MNHDNETPHESAPYSLYLLTWLALVLLTATTVTVAGLNFGRLSILVALVIAGIKSSIVLTWFMHLRQESKLFHMILLVTIVVLVIAIGLTFTDILYR